LEKVSDSVGFGICHIPNLNLWYTSEGWPLHGLGQPTYSKQILKSTAEILQHTSGILTSIHVQLTKYNNTLKAATEQYFNEP